MYPDIAVLLLGALLMAPVAFMIGSRHERHRADEQRRYLRRVTGVRTTVARPGTTVATVRTASLRRPDAVKSGNASPRK